MSEKTKEVELCDDKQLFGELRHFTHEYMGTITIEIEGTITPIKIFSSNHFRDTRLFQMKTGNSVSMMMGIGLPTFKVLKEDLWCSALRDEIIAYLESIPPNYNYMDSRLVKSAMPYVLKKLRSEGRPRILALQQGAKLIGELEVVERCMSYDLKFAGKVVLAGSREELVDLFEFNDIFRPSWPDNRPTRFVRKNKHLWNKKLADLVLAFIAEITDFAGDRFEKDLEEGKRYISRKSGKARFCNQLRDGLLKADEEKLQDPAVLGAFESISSICGFELDTKLL